jgi:SAM-dependent methyltransferase
MTKDEILRLRRQIISDSGPWTNHNLHLGFNIYTMDNPAVLDYSANVDQIKDFVGPSFKNLRVVDFGCLEGGYAIHFAQQGANVVGIEGRQSSVTKANFSREVLGLENLCFHTDDCRNFSLEKYGAFDIVFCQGLFYHLDFPSLVIFLEKVAEACNRVCYLNTHVAVDDHRLNPSVQHLGPMEELVYRGLAYRGRKYLEHPVNMPQSQRLKQLWSSLDNTFSFWLSIESLTNTLLASGFTRVYQLKRREEQPDRREFIAVK